MPDPRDLTTATRWRKARFSLLHRQELSRQASGVMQGKSLGAALWRAEFESARLPRVEAEALEADFDTLSGVVGSFLAHTAERPRPVSIKGAANGVSVAGIGSTEPTLSLSGLAPGAELSRGDFLSILTQIGGRELVRLAEGGVADGIGLTPALRIAPLVRPSVAVGDAVTLINPMIELRLEPESLSVEAIDKLFARVSFKAVQVVR